MYGPAPAVAAESVSFPARFRSSASPVPGRSVGDELAVSESSALPLGPELIETMPPSLPADRPACCSAVCRSKEEKTHTHKLHPKENSSNYLEKL